MKIAAAIAGVSVAAALLLSGCGSSLNHGVITGKEYDAPWTYWQSQCVSYTKYGLCRSSVTVPVYYPADYILDLKDGKQTGSTEVDESTWDNAKVGEKYP